MAFLVAPIFGLNTDTGTDQIISASATNGAIDSPFTGTTGAVSGVGTNTSFASGQYVLMHQTIGTGAGQWERNVITAYSPGSITFALPLTNTYSTGAQILVLSRLRSLTINSGVTYNTKAYTGSVGGIFSFVTNRFILNGTLNGAARGLRGGAGGVDSVVGTQGESTSGVGGGSASANVNGGGGGTNLGGNGTGATTAVGTTDLATILMGGGGGGANVPSGQTAVNGGAGGAIIILWTRYLDITGAITVNGQAAQAGYRASGAGAGGSVLIFADQITHLGSNAITALGGATAVSSNGGGTGGGGSHATSGTNGSNVAGGAGGNGRIAIAKCRIDDAGTTNPTYVDKGYQTYCGIVGRG